MQKIAVKLKPAAERHVKKGHPWVFEDSIVSIKKTPKTGDICVIFENKKNKFLALGLYDSDSVIKIKCLQFHKQEEFNLAFLKNKILDAYEKRKILINDKNNSFRLIYGENDFLPSLIVDIYNKVGVIKLYSLIWKDYLNEIVKIIVDLLNLDNVVLRLSRNIEDVAKKDNLFDGLDLYGTLNNPNIVFTENNIKFYANVKEGHKTGFFLDQKHNRQKISEITENKNVLDVFSYNGGFSLSAMKGDAKSVTSVDISNQAIESIRHNIKLNNFKNQHIAICGDAFKILEDLISQNKKYDIVIIDPPSFAKKESEIDSAKKQYIRLAKLGSQLINKNGILLLASCSSRVSSEEFFECNDIGFKQSNFNLKLYSKTYHNIDHVAIIPELEYLKCGFYKI